MQIPFHSDVTCYCSCFFVALRRMRWFEKINAWILTYFFQLIINFTSLVAPLIISWNNTIDCYLSLVISKTLHKICNWFLSRFCVYFRIKFFCSNVDDYVAWFFFINTKFYLIFHASDLCSWQILNIILQFWSNLFDRSILWFVLPYYPPILYAFFLIPFWHLWQFCQVPLFVILTIIYLYLV